MKYENEKLQFAVNIPYTITLENEPSTAKQYENTYKNDDGSESVVKSWLFFASGKKMFFATEKLFRLLSPFRKGDTVTIIKMQLPGQRAISWKVDSGEQTSAVINDVAGILSEINNNINSLKQLIITALNDKNPKITLDQVAPVGEKAVSSEDDFDSNLGF